MIEVHKRRLSICIVGCMFAHNLPANGHLLANVL